MAKEHKWDFRDFGDMKTRTVDINIKWNVKDTKLVKMEANLLPPTVVRVCD